MVKINAVKMVRDIRDDIYKQTKSMTRKELIAYYRNRTKQVHEKLGIKTKTAKRSSS